MFVLGESVKCLDGDEQVGVVIGIFVSNHREALYNCLFRDDETDKIYTRKMEAGNITNYDLPDCWPSSN